MRAAALRRLQTPFIAEPRVGLLLQRMLRLLNHFTAEEMVANFVHLEQFK